MLDLDLGEGALAGAEQDREDQQVVAVDEVRGGEAPGQLGAPVEEQRSAVTGLQRGDVLEVPSPW